MNLNPFALGGVVTGKRFAGRVREIERLHQIALAGQHAYLFAPRRYGKTSLLREGLGDAERAKRLVVVWCDCLRRGVPNCSSIEDAIAAAGRLRRLRRLPVVLVLDEFQQIAEWDTDHKTEAVLRAAIQHFEGVSCIFAGSKRHPLFKPATPFLLSRLPRTEIEPWLAGRFGETGRTLDKEALDRLVSITVGNPWATQYLAHFVWEVAVGTHAERITPDVVHEGLRRAVEAGDTIYARDYASLTPSQRQALTAIATESTDKPLGAAYLRKHALPAKSTVSQSLGSLLEKGYLEREGPFYFASDPLFGEWLRRLGSGSAGVTIRGDG